MVDSSSGRYLSVITLWFNSFPFLLNMNEFPRLYSRDMQVELIKSSNVVVEVYEYRHVIYSMFNATRVGGYRGLEDSKNK